MLSFLGFLAASALIILLPGPDTMNVVRSLLRGGRRSAVKTAAGVCTGLSVWVVVATAGVSAVLRASHDGYLALRVVGAAYLVVLGVQALRSRGATAELAEESHGRRGIFGTGYVAGVASDLFNPKVGVFFVTFLPAFIPHGASVTGWSLLLGFSFVAMTALYFVVFLAAADRIVARLRHARTRQRMDRATGVVLIGLGARLAFE